MPSTNRLTPGDLMVLLAETDVELAWWREQDGHPYAKLWIEALLARKLAARTSRPEPMPA